MTSGLPGTNMPCHQRLIKRLRRLHGEDMQGGYTQSSVTSRSSYTMVP